ALNLPDTPTVFQEWVCQPAGEIGEMKKDEKKDVQQKTSFTLRLVKFDESKKIALIKEIKNVVPGLNLVQAKKYVETLPQIVKEDIGQTEAEKLKEQITAAGGECSADVLHTPTGGSSFGQEVPRRPMTIFFSRPFNVTQHFLHPSQSESFEQRKSSSSGRLFGEGHFPGFS
ncbi:ribosomal protein L7/L12, partial [Trichinella spiralis]|uniref:ribosomal protein L7/L12 n=1 Tax=Trichinella spiralis TaxID=6334 RepID=UPI0001EFEB7A